MVNKLKIPLDYLKNNNIYKFEEIAAFEDLGILPEKDVAFIEPIHIRGKAYIAGDMLIMTLNINFLVLLPCAICNEFFEKEIIIKNLTITEKILKGGSVYGYKDEIRNACFLEIPSYVQCSNKCSKQNNIKKYLNTTKENYPFSSLKEL